MRENRKLSVRNELRTGSGGDGMRRDGKQQTDEQLLHRREGGSAGKCEGKYSGAGRDIARSLISGS